MTFLEPIIKTKLYKALPEILWEKWTTHEGLKTFFGESNHVELQIGGAFEIYFLMKNPEGLKGSETCKILAYLPQEMLVFSWNAPPHLAVVRNQLHKTWVVLFFKPLSLYSTQLELHHAGFLANDHPQWQQTRQYFENAWDAVLQNLEESL